MSIYSENLLKKLRLKQKSYVDTISKNGCANIEEYRFQAGIIRGINYAIKEAVELHKAFYDETVIQSEDYLNEDSNI